MRKYMKNNTTNILERKEFKEPSIKGEYVYGTYVIFSYTTPIAIYTADTWYLTTEKFSVTTSTQQSALNMILDDENITFTTPEMFRSMVDALDGLTVSK